MQADTDTDTEYSHVQWEQGIVHNCHVHCPLWYILPFCTVFIKTQILKLSCQLSTRASDWENAFNVKVLYTRQSLGFPRNIYKSSYFSHSLLSRRVLFHIIYLHSVCVGFDDVRKNKWVERGGTPHQYLLANAVRQEHYHVTVFTSVSANDSQLYAVDKRLVGCVFRVTIEVLAPTTSKS